MLNQSAIARPATIAWATGEESDPSIANPSRTWTAGWAMIRGAVPRCGQVAVSASLDDGAQVSLIVLRDSEEPRGHVHYTTEEWRTFVRGIKAGEFDGLGR